MRQMPNDQEKLRSLLEEVHSDSFSWACVCCRGNREDAADALQSTYLRILSGAARFGGDSSFKTWLFGVIRMTSLEHHRRRRRSIFTFLFAAETIDDDRPSPEVVALQGETASRISKLLAALPGRQREVLHLVFYQELTVAQAAQTLAISTGTAARHYERGKAALRKRWERE